MYASTTMITNATIINHHGNPPSANRSVTPPAPSIGSGSGVRGTAAIALVITVAVGSGSTVASGVGDAAISGVAVCVPPVAVRMGVGVGLSVVDGDLVALD